MCPLSIFRRPRRSSGDPPPLLETSRTFFDTAEAPEALIFFHVEGLSDVYKSLKVHLGQGSDLITSIQIYLKYKYSTKMLDFVCFVLMITNITNF